MTHYVIVPRGTQGTGRDSAMARFAKEVAERAGGAPVHVGFMDGGLPSLREALDDALAAGAATIVVLPLAVPSDMNLTGWTRRVASEWAAAQDEAPDVRLGRLADDGASAAAVATAFAGETLEIEPKAGAISDPAWTRIPAPRHHVLICRGPRCSARGSAANYRRLLAELEARDIPAAEVLVTRTPCLSPCNRGPMVAVYPDDVWYGEVDEDVVTRVVDEHLAGGVPVADAAPERG